MDDYLKKFMHFLTVEKRMAKNTLLSYERDLKSYLQYIKHVEAVESLNDVQRVHIVQFLSFLKEQGKSAKTLARHVASIRAFHQFLLREQVTNQDPSVHIETPKSERSVPKVLSIEEVERLLDLSNGQGHFGLRDKAMLELLYATGIRVSELIQIDIEHINLTMGFVHVSVKVIKSELFQLENSSRGIKKYIEDGRINFIAKNQTSDALFLNHHGKRLSRQGFWKILKSWQKKREFRMN